MFYLLPLLWFADPLPSLLQVTYDFEFKGTERRVSAQLALHKLEDGRFSIHCRKAPSGTLFTYWAEPERDVLTLPKDDLAFVGPAGQAVRLFPDGPSLHRDQWLALLLDGIWPGHPAWDFSRDDKWYVLNHREQEWTIRWRVKRMKYKNRYSKRILEARLSDRLEIKPLGDLELYWHLD